MQWMDQNNLPFSHTLQFFLFVVTQGKTHKKLQISCGNTLVRNKIYDFFFAKVISKFKKTETEYI